MVDNDDKARLAPVNIVVQILLDSSSKSIPTNFGVILPSMLSYAFVVAHIEIKMIW